MKIFFSVGEPSGDLHGANLIRELREISPAVKCVGYGGPRMSKAGCSLHEDLTQLAVMWFLRAILNLHRFWNLVGRADRYFRHHKPDAVILIDYPGFNWWIARRAKVHGIPVFYYGAPQMWAWAGWRVRKMRQLVDHVLCKLPFAVEWYRERGCNATYVGHPYFDELLSYKADMNFVESQRRSGSKLVTILPGSRSQEVRAHLKQFVATAELIHKQRPETRFAIAAFNERQAKSARDLVRSRNLPAEVHVGRTPELILAADACLACSGSVSLELLHYQKPSVILYQISPLAFWIQQHFRRVRYITLVNLLASERPFCNSGELYDPDFEDVPFPEYLTWRNRSRTLAEHVDQWLSTDDARRQTISQLRDLKAQFAETGASRRAAEFIIGRLTPQPVHPQLHYVPPPAA